MNRLLWMVLAVLLALPYVAAAQTSNTPTGNEEAICRNDPNVFFCENWEDWPTGTLPNGTPPSPRYKNMGWSTNIFNQAVVTDQSFDGTKSHRLTIPADNTGPFIQTVGSWSSDFGAPALPGKTIYVRWYERISGNHVIANSNIPNSVGEKNFELSFNDGASFFLYTLEPVSGFSGQAGFPTDQMKFPFHGTKTGNTNNNFLQNRNGAGVPSSPVWMPVGDQWYCMEVRVTLPTSTNLPISTNQGSGNGYVQGWVDGIQRWEYPQVQVYLGNVGIQTILWSAYWNGSEGFPNSQMPAGTHPLEFKWVDNIVASTSRIGCLGAPPPTFTLTVNTVGSGTVTPSTSSYSPGTVVPVTATPIGGATFTGWSGACTGTGACSVTMDANKTVTATFTAAPPPYQPSALLTNLTWDFANKVRAGLGSDIWSTTWATNDTLFTGFADGGGGNGTDVICRTHFGINTLTGSPPNFTFNNLWGCRSLANGEQGCTGTPPFQHSAACDAPFGGTAATVGPVQSVLAIGNTLYAVIFNNAGIAIYTSADLGQSWTAASWSFPFTTGNFVPQLFVQNGQGYAGNTDGFVYLVGGKFGSLTESYLARVPIASVMSNPTTPNTWQWYTSQNPLVPTWGTFANARPMHVDPASGGDGNQGGGAMTYFPSLARYIYIPLDNQIQKMHVFDAPNPWGPWTTVYYNNGWGPVGAPYGTQGAVSFNPMAKFITVDDATHVSFWLTFSGGSGTGVNDWDNYNLIHGTLTRVPAPGTTESFPTNGPTISAGQDLPWTQFGTQTIQVSGNAAVAPPPASSAVNDRARAEVDLATSTHFAQAEVRFNSPGAVTAGAAVIARYSSSTDSSYDFFLYTTDSGLSYKAGLYKTVNGVTDFIARDIFNNPIFPDKIVTSLVNGVGGVNTIRLDVGGSSPNIYAIGSINGQAVNVATNLTDFDGNVRTGIALNKAAGNTLTEVTVDNFSAGVVAPATSPIAAASCRQFDVAAAIAKANAGDTVTIPAGQCTIAAGTSWTDTFDITKQINLQGAGDGTGATRGCGSCTTVIQHNRDMADTGCCLFRPPQALTWHVSPTGGTSSVSSISGIQWQGAGVYQPGINPTDGILALFGDGSQKNFRMHHSRFVPRGGCNPLNSLQCTSTAGFVLHNLHGVVDHNACDLAPGNGPCNYTFESADSSWSLPSTMGSDDAMYFEDNDFFGPASNIFQFANDGWLGDRVVFRDNFYRNTVLANHGTDSGGRNARSQRHMEVYDNTILAETGNTPGATWSSFRGGTGMLFNNTMTNQPGGGFAAVNQPSDLRNQPNSAKDYSSFGRCGAVAVSLSSSGTTVTATAATEFVNNGALQGYIRITSDGTTPAGYVGTWGTTGSSAGTNVQFTITSSGLANATGVATSPWDQNSDTTGYACLDQAGRGMGDNWNGAADPAGGNPANAVWPHQLPEPIYAWNNLNQGSPELMNSIYPAVVVNRDFYNAASGLVSARPATCTPFSGYYATDEKRLYQCTATNTWTFTYSPLIYPHPLVAPPAPQPPAAPTNLRIVP